MPSYAEIAAIRLGFGLSPRLTPPADPSEMAASVAAATQFGPQAVTLDKVRAWQDKEGNNRRSAEVVADNVYFGDSRRDSDGSSGGNYANNSYGGNNGGYSAPAGGYAAPVGGSGFSEIDEEDGDLPF